MHYAAIVCVIFLLCVYFLFSFLLFFYVNELVVCSFPAAFCVFVNKNHTVLEVLPLRIVFDERH